MAGKDEAAYKRHILDAMTDVLDNEIKPIVFDILHKHIQTDIYNAYTPTKGGWVSYNPETGNFRRGVTYQRRYVLLDPKNNYSKITYATEGETQIATLHATIDAQVAPFPRKRPFRYKGHGSFLELLELGRLGIFTRAKFGGGTFPRPAVANTQKEVDDSPRIMAAINRFKKKAERI